jgi:hypothetical protein
VGKPQPQRYCTNCGAEVRPNNSFCVACGASLRRGAPPAGSKAVADDIGSQPRRIASGSGGPASGPKAGRLRRWFGGLHAVPKLAALLAALAVVFALAGGWLSHGLYGTASLAGEGAGDPDTSQYGEGAGDPGVDTKVGRTQPDPPYTVVSEETSADGVGIRHVTAEIMLDEGTTNGQVLDRGSAIATRLATEYAIDAYRATGTYDYLMLIVNDEYGGAAMVNANVSPRYDVPVLDVPQGQYQVIQDTYGWPD